MKKFSIIEGGLAFNGKITTITHDLFVYPVYLLNYNDDTPIAEGRLSKFFKHDTPSGVVLASSTIACTLTLTGLVLTVKYATPPPVGGENVIVFWLL